MTLQNSVTVPGLATLATLNSALGHFQAVLPFATAAPLRRYLDTVGDGTGTKNIQSNQTLEEVFSIAPGVDEVIVVTALDIFISTDGSLVLDDEELYGSISSLGTGLALAVETDSSHLTTELDLLHGLTIQKNRDWLRAGAVQSPNAFATMSSVQFRMDIAGLDGSAIVLGPNDNDRLALTVPGGVDLSGLAEHYILAHGFLLDVS